MTESTPGQCETAAGTVASEGEFVQAILFTGHMIDSPDRKVPRFPPRAEAAAETAIHDAVLRLVQANGSPAVGVAGGASGGDVLFHEVCGAMGVATRLRLALPAAEFAAKSVAPAGGDWIQRLQALVERLGPENVRVMGEDDGLLEGRTQNIWQRANLWMIEEALHLARERTLLALWDGRGGDGPGGTEHLVSIAPRYGIRVAPVIPMQTLFV